MAAHLESVRLPGCAVCPRVTPVKHRERERERERVKSGLLNRIVAFLTVVSRLIFSAVTFSDYVWWLNE